MNFEYPVTFVPSTFDHIVSIQELEDGDLITVGTVIVPEWYAYGNA